MQVLSSGWFSVVWLMLAARLVREHLDYVIRSTSCKL